ncbi:hypothetical protein [Mesorhizobium japonicum]|uniref:Mlr8558 protein n=1 Tax=Mesorhizobium japonicum (strain LMG 29417 / CECT 9101 / MAFF 303099) TaxID=266835 RepID=Q982N9_RHILO|nr:hypothetical protein [Mesorhizobium japonicum]BAB54417.1 mlr8558 [Mesorhizobium japonicum MAFF 303099]
MDSERLTVRSAYRRGWQVVENNHAIETFDSKVEAFNFVHARGARVRLTWDRTVIGGQTAHYDFAASFGDTGVGRIMKEQHGPSAGTWFWTCYDGGARGTVATKDEEVVGVEVAYARRVAGADLPR